MKKYSKKLLDEQNKKGKDENYSLHKQAISDLVNATPENSPEVSSTELKTFKTSKLNKIPVWIKALFIKFWFAGSVYFFIVWGLGILINDYLDEVLVFALAMGMVTDILTNNALRFFDTDGGYRFWMAWDRKGILSMLFNVLYAGALYFVVGLIYNGINLFCINVLGADPNFVQVAGEPILFAVFYLLLDVGVIGLREFFKRLVYDANKKLTEKDKNI